jgi:hypothetical protein
MDGGEVDTLSPPTFPIFPIRPIGREYSQVTAGINDRLQEVTKMTGSNENETEGESWSTTDSQSSLSPLPLIASLHINPTPLPTLPHPLPKTTPKQSTRFNYPPHYKNNPLEAYFIQQHKLFLHLEKRYHKFNREARKQAELAREAKEKRRAERAKWRANPVPVKVSKERRAELGIQRDDKNKEKHEMMGINTAAAGVRAARTVSTVGILVSSRGTVVSLRSQRTVC